MNFQQRLAHLERRQREARNAPPRVPSKVVTDEMIVAAFELAYPAHLRTEEMMAMRSKQLREEMERLNPKTAGNPAEGMR